MNNILVTGAKGQLGSEIKELVMNDELRIMNEKDNNSKLITQNSKFIFTDSDTLDITDFQKVRKFIEENNINAIINCAAYTAVDKAEKEQELANLINHQAAKNLAQITKENNIFLVHISTDYVFDGENYKPYHEDDRVNPVNTYGLSKLKGEEAIKEINPNAIIIRTSWVYSSFGHNFVKTMLKLAKTRDELKVVYDQIGSPTYARDLANVILQIINYELGVMNFNKNNIIQHSKLNIHNSVTVYHFSNEGVCSWYDFAKAIFEISNIDIKVNPIETKDYPTLAKRPQYSVLNKSKIKEDFNIEIPYWRDSLFDCIKKIMSYEL